MFAQSCLTLLIDALVLSFIAIASLDFVAGLLPPRKQLADISPSQLSLLDIKPQPLLQLPDPWLLPLNDTDEVVAQIQHQHKPLLLLPQALVEVEERSPVEARADLALDEFLAGVELDKLQLRLARKIVKALGITQKVNGKDQPLSWLKSQIKTKLQQPQEISAEVVEAVQVLLAS